MSDRCATVAQHGALHFTMAFSSASLGMLAPTQKAHTSVMGIKAKGSECLCLDYSGP